MKITYKINETEVSDHVYFDVLDVLRDFCVANPKLAGIQFSVEKTYYVDAGKLNETCVLYVKDSFFRELYLAKLNELNDVLGL